MLKIGLLLLMTASGIDCARSVVEIEMGKHNYKENTDSRTYKLEQSQTFKFASYYGDHMVLQSSPDEAVVWGYAPMSAVDATVEIDILGPTNQTHKTTVRDDGKWVVMLDPIERGGPYHLTARLLGKIRFSNDKRLLSNKRLTTHKITLTDVLFGDVWVCSGQSNMQFSLSEVFNASEEIADSAHYPDVRLFMVADKTSDTPLDDLPTGGVHLPWSRPNPATVKGFSAVCWLYGKYLYDSLGYPIGLVETCWGGTPIEAWSSPDVLDKCDVPDHTYSEQITNAVEPGSVDVSGPRNNSVLWNAMVHPLLNMTIYGAIWYQGEANVNYNMDLYNCTFPEMISDWREKFNAAGGTSSLFPFGFVQLAGNTPDHTIDTGFPDIRWHQTADYGYVPNDRLRKVFMAVAMDLPDFTSPHGTIHPRYKQDVARRLVLSGLGVAYHKNVSYEAPYPKAVNVTTNCDPYWENPTCVFVYYDMEVDMRSFEDFEVCCAFTNPPVCETGKSWWLPTTPIYMPAITVFITLSCPAENIVGVRYAWRESPCPYKKCNFYGITNKLPMSPFIYSGENFVKGRIGDKNFVVDVTQ